MRPDLADLEARWTGDAGDSRRKALVAILSDPVFEEARLLAESVALIPACLTSGRASLQPIAEVEALAKTRALISAATLEAFSRLDKLARGGSRSEPQPIRAMKQFVSEDSPLSPEHKQTQRARKNP